MRARDQRDLSQPEFRKLLSEAYGIVSEEVVKYAYDNYTFKKKIRPIRKKKVRAKVAKEFHASLHGGVAGKHAVHTLIAHIVAGEENE